MVALEWLRADLVALLLLVALGASNVLTPQEALSGFSRSAVITILSMFILTAGLARTGATRALGATLVRWGGRSEWSMIVVLMSVAAFLSLFMNNIAAASVLLPVAVGLSRERNISPSKLMMPLSFGTLLGGMATLLTTSNILVSSALRDANYAPFGLFDFAPIGIPVLVVGIVAVAGSRLGDRLAEETRRELERETRLVHVYRYSIDRIALPEIDFSVLCSKGFYVRTYVHDIGEALGCGAHLKSLRRIKSGRFDVANAITVDQIKNAPREEILSRMLSLPEVSRMRGA